MEAGGAQGTARSVRASRLCQRAESRPRARTCGTLCRDRSFDHPRQLPEKKVAVLSHTERRAMVEHQAEALALSTQAELLSISRSSLYYQPVPPPPKEVALKHRIDELYTTYPFY